MNGRTGNVGVDRRIAAALTFLYLEVLLVAAFLVDVVEVGELAHLALAFQAAGELRRPGGTEVGWRSRRAEGGRRSMPEVRRELVELMDLASRWSTKT